MLEQIKQKLQEEETQRAALTFGAAIVTFVASYAVNKAIGAGMSKLVDVTMEKLHPTTETPAE